MFNDISSWLDVYGALHRQAIEVCGAIEIANDDSGVIRWPLTRGADVITIAAAIEPYVQAHSSDAYGLERRWRAIAEDLARCALLDPLDEYAENRSFWRALPAVCVYLHDAGAPLPPPEIWDALAAQLADAEPRNVGPKGDGPFGHFDGVKTFDDLYRAQYKHLRDARGADELAPEPGMGGGVLKIPRTTNADVIVLADYWSKQFADVKVVFGHEGAVTRWKRARADIDAIARKGDPNAVYPKNNGFWRDLQNTAIHVAVADEAPTKWDLALDSIKDSVKNLPENIKVGTEKAANALASAAGDLALGVGKIANEAGKGLFSGFGTPLLVGAGLVGLFLISRNRNSSEAAS